ncbi:MAG: 50S ribosomal protein L24 [Holosporaceae bacterium]|jgi:large subunit ribosomal protein L24|nr:50S ribosomal protein L24 [Holosporaceae bacterium]
MDKWKIKKGDTVQLISGKDKGVRGEVLHVLRDERRVVVKGVNVCTRHKKPSASDPGGLIKGERSVHASNVMLIDPADDKPVRTGVKMIDGKKVRTSKRTGVAIS